MFDAATERVRKHVSTEPGGSTRRSANPSWKPTLQGSSRAPLTSGRIPYTGPSSSCHYSPNVLEDDFSEVRKWGPPGSPIAEVPTGQERPGGWGGAQNTTRTPRRAWH
jgi:hypothetical protein